MRCRWIRAAAIAFGVAGSAGSMASTAAAAPAAAGSTSSSASASWPQRVRLVAAGTVAYPGKAARTVHLEFDVVFVRAEAPDPSMSGGWYVPAPKSVVSQSMSSAADQWCPIVPRTALVPVDRQQSFLKLDMPASRGQILVGSLISAARQPPVTIGIASCNNTAITQVPLVFQTFPRLESVIGEDGTMATLATGEPFPTARGNSSVRHDPESPLYRMTWTLSPVGE